MLPATGSPLFYREFSSCGTILLTHGSQHICEWDCRESSRVIGQAVRDNQFAIIQCHFVATEWLGR